MEGPKEGDLKRYTLEVELNSPKEVAEVTRALNAEGISNEDIDLVNLSPGKKRGFRIKRMSGSFKMAVRGWFIGLIAGIVLSPVIEDLIGLDFSGAFPNVPLASYLIAALLMSQIGLIIGLIVGIKNRTYELKYDSKSSKAVDMPNLLLAVNVGWEDEEKVKNVLSKYIPENPIIVDNKYEVEAGIR